MRKEDEEEPLSPMARIFQYPGIDTCVVIIIGFKSKINVDVIVAELTHNVSKHPRFSSKLGKDNTKWIKTKVNVEDHVVIPSIDLEQIGEDGDGFVDDYVSHLTTIPLDKSKPLWDIHILNVKTSDAEAVVVTRSHHSLGDGASLMSLLIASTRKTSDLEAFPSIPNLKRRETTSHGLREKNWPMKFILAMCNNLRLIWNTFVDILLFSAMMLFVKDTETPLKVNKSSESIGKSKMRRFCYRTVSLDDIKLIKETMNMTINDVLLGVTQAALSHYMNDQYGKKNSEGATSTPDSNNLPDKIRFSSVVVVNLRSKVGIQPLADMMLKGSNCRWGNHISSVILPFSIGLEKDPLIYLSKSKSAMNRKKNSFFASVGYWGMWLMPKILGDKIGAILSRRFTSATTSFVSNIVGPVEEVSFQGHPIAYIALSTYGYPQALCIHFISYAKKMIISVSIDPSVIPDPQKLLDEMEDSLKAMKSALHEGVSSRE